MLTDHQRQVVFGTLLGDGCLDKPVSGNSRLMVRHSAVHLEYTLYKNEALKPLSLDVFTYSYVDRRTGKTYVQVGFNTIRHGVFTDLYETFYWNGVKHVPATIVPHMDEVALTIFVGDDGTFDRASNTVKISVDRYDQHSRLLIQKWLLERFGIETTIQRDRIYIKRKSYTTLVDMVSKYMPAFLRYKLGFP